MQWIAYFPKVPRPSSLSESTPLVGMPINHRTTGKPIDPKVGRTGCHELRHERNAGKHVNPS